MKADLFTINHASKRYPFDTRKVIEQKEEGWNTFSELPQEPEQRMQPGTYSRLERSITMFDTGNIQQNPGTMQWICACQCNSAADAEYLCAKYMIIARSFDTVGELYNRDSVAYIGASTQQAAETIANYINASYWV